MNRRCPWRASRVVGMSERLSVAFSSLAGEAPAPHLFLQSLIQLTLRAFFLPGDRWASDEAGTGVHLFLGRWLGGVPLLYV